nr:uncharacterized protein At4g29660 isoform X1 [Ipomoea batatas]
MGLHMIGPQIYNRNHIAKPFQLQDDVAAVAACRSDANPAKKLQADAPLPTKKLGLKMVSYMFRKYSEYLYTKWERTILWDMVEPYRRPRSFTPLVTVYISAFYTGVIGAAITEQLYKEKYWEDHPGEMVPFMKPMFYGGPWRVMRGDVPPTGKFEL